MKAKDMKVTLSIVATVLFLSGCANLPATGQSDWYRNDGTVAGCDDFSGFDGPRDVPPGQDGRFMVGCAAAGRFVAAGSVVTDNCTGLTWQRSFAGPMTWADALVFTRDLALAGSDDWRLPNVNELLSIVDYGRSDPALNPAFELPSSPGEFPPPEGIIYWSSTSFEALTTPDGWTVEFVDGTHKHVPKTLVRSVRAVRGGSIRRRPLVIAACEIVIGP